MAKGKTLEDPFEHCKTAQKHENSGNREAAETAFKKAIKAADALPMEEYREHLRVVTRELGGGSGKDQALDLEAVTGAYHELLAMPFLTRIQLAGYYARHNMLPEARQVCNEAFERGLDSETLRTPVVAIMDQRAGQLHQVLRIFTELFERLDTNHDNFVDEAELRRALLDIEIDDEGHALVRFLLHNYESVMQSSKDQMWFQDYLASAKPI